MESAHCLTQFLRLLLVFISEFYTELSAWAVCHSFRPFISPLPPLCIINVHGYTKKTAQESNIERNGLIALSGWFCFVFVFANNFRCASVHQLHHTESSFIQFSISI